MPYCSNCGSEFRPGASYCEVCGVVVPDVGDAETRRRATPSTGGESVGKYAGKDRNAAIILAVCSGFMGGHKFYLGEVGKGFLYLFFWWTFIPAWLSLYEALMYYAKPSAFFETDESTDASTRSANASAGTVDASRSSTGTSSSRTDTSSGRPEAESATGKPGTTAPESASATPSGSVSSVEGSDGVLTLSARNIRIEKNPPGKQPRVTEVSLGDVVRIELEEPDGFRSGHVHVQRTGFNPDSDVDRDVRADLIKFGQGSLDEFEQFCAEARRAVENDGSDDHGRGRPTETDGSSAADEDSRTTDDGAAQTSRETNVD
jgi:hypothetical protein